MESKQTVSQRSKVILQRCDSYDHQRIYQLLGEALEQLGGVSHFFRRGETILLKPNMLCPSTEAQAVCTNPAVLEAVIMLVKEAGATPIVGDSPGLGSVQSVARKCGIAAVCDKHGVELAPFTEGVAVDNPDGVVLRNVLVAKRVREADAVVSLAKLKTHGLTGYTGAVKNLFGCVPGLNKAQLHFRFKQVTEFSQALVDIHSLIKPRLSIIDGIIGMEGHGPRSGRPVALGVLLVSTDSHAADATACRIIGLDPMKIPTTRLAHETAVGAILAEQIEVVGPALRDVAPRQFDRVPVPMSAGLRLPPPLASLVQSLLVARPRISVGKCVGCAICASSCPAKTILIEGRKARIDYSKCINCYCCQELCPESAITLRRSRFIEYASRLLPQQRKRPTRSS